MTEPWLSEPKAQGGRVIPTPGRIVQYFLSEDDVVTIRRYRGEVRETLVGRSDLWWEGVDFWANVEPGEGYPLLIVKPVRPDGSRESAPSNITPVNGKVQLDGYDVHWVRGAIQDPAGGPGTWRSYI